jgi:hypothetical protein
MYTCYSDLYQVIKEEQTTQNMYIYSVTFLTEN